MTSSTVRPQSASSTASTNTALTTIYNPFPGQQTAPPNSYPPAEVSNPHQQQQQPPRQLYTHDSWPAPLVTARAPTPRSEVELADRAPDDSAAHQSYFLTQAMSAPFDPQANYYSQATSQQQQQQQYGAHYQFAGVAQPPQFSPAHLNHLSAAPPPLNVWQATRLNLPPAFASQEQPVAGGAHQSAMMGYEYQQYPPPPAPNHVNAMPNPVVPPTPTHVPREQRRRAKANRAQLQLHAQYPASGGEPLVDGAGAQPYSPLEAVAGSPSRRTRSLIGRPNGPQQQFVNNQKFHHSMPNGSLGASELKHATNAHQQMAIADAMGASQQAPPAPIMRGGPMDSAGVMHVPLPFTDPNAIQAKLAAFGTPPGSARSPRSLMNPTAAARDSNEDLFSLDQTTGGLHHLTNRAVGRPPPLVSGGQWSASGETPHNGSAAPPAGSLFALSQHMRQKQQQAQISLTAPFVEPPQFGGRQQANGPYANGSPYSAAAHPKPGARGKSPRTRLN